MTQRMGLVYTGRAKKVSPKEFC